MRAIWPGTLLIVYLAATGLLLLVGREHVGSGGIVVHFGVLAALTAATRLRSVPRWLRDWSPILALLFLYSEMPMLIRAAGHQQLFDATVMGWERALFRGQPSLELAAEWPSRVLSEVLHLAYLSYYPIILSIPAALYFTSRRGEFSEATFALMFTFVVCFLLYIVFPVAGPRYLQVVDAPGGPVRSTVVWLLEARSSRGTAFPSSHVAVAATQSVLATRYFGVKGLVVAVLSAGLALGAVYGGFHYAVDVFAGVALGLVTSWIALAVSTKTTAVILQAKATAPT